MFLLAVCCNATLCMMQAMYIRVKRNKTTYFVQCDPTETTLDIKQKLQNLIDQPSNNQRLTLVATNDILDDSKTLAEQKVIIFKQDVLTILQIWLLYKLLLLLFFD